MIHRFAHATQKKPEPPEPPKSQPMQLMPLMKTGKRWCKWPVKDDPDVIGGFLCCGRATTADDVYCSEHRAVASPIARPERTPRLRDRSD
jgi:hypothetical protein